MRRTVAAFAFVTMCLSTAQVSTAHLSLGVVSGIVIENDTGTPVPFAEVRLEPEAPSNGAPQETMTSEDGTFEITGVAAGYYYLAADKSPFAPVFRNASGSTTDDPGTPFAVADGQTIKDVCLRLMPGGVISGRVIDPFGQPAIEVEIEAEQVPASAGRDEAPSPFYFSRRNLTRTTDARGLYRFYGLPPGDYVVHTAEADGQITVGATKNAAMRPATVFFPGVTNPALAAPVRVTSGEERTGIDLAMRLVRPLKLEGTVALPAGVPSNGVIVRLRPRIDIGAQWNATRVQPNGRVCFFDVQPGEYWLTATATTTNYQPGAPTYPSWWAVLPVNLTDRDVSGIYVSLQPTMTVSGRVVDDGPMPIGLRDFVISLTTIDQASPIPASSTRGQTDQSGRFSVTSVMPGVHRIIVRERGQKVAIESISVGGRILADGRIDVGAGATISDLVVKIKGT